MEVLTSKAVRRSTRLRVEISVNVTSLDRMRPFAEKCVALVVSSQGCGFRSSRALPVGTPILLNELPAGGSVTGRVANCLPLGKGVTNFLIGASLYTHGNFWGIPNPPADWDVAPRLTADLPGAEYKAGSPKMESSRQAWPYNMFATSAEVPLAKK